jgi:xanthine dehydrogenase accessory factor
VLGDSPVARALCDLAPRVGFAVSAPELDPEAFPATSAHAKAWVVVATQGRGDLPALEAALAGSPRCIWFVASARKAGVLKDALLASGHAPARVAAIVAPAGTPIGARTPEEIALSVLAAVVAARRETTAPADLTPTTARADDIHTLTTSGA